MFYTLINNQGLFVNTCGCQKNKYGDHFLWGYNQNYIMNLARYFS